MTDPVWPRLPCGADPAPLLTFVADRAGPPTRSHAATCPYCRAALDELTERWRPVTEWVHRDIRLPDRFLDTLVARVRRIVQSPHHVASSTRRGTTTVTSWVLGIIASAAARGTLGVSAVNGVPASSGHRAAVRDGADGVAIAEAGAAGITAALGITAAAAPGALPDLAALAEAVRADVIAAIDAHTSIHTVEVDVTIDDLEP